MPLLLRDGWRERDSNRTDCTEHYRRTALRKPYCGNRNDHNFRNDYRNTGTNGNNRSTKRGNPLRIVYLRDSFLGCRLSRCRFGSVWWWSHVNRWRQFGRFEPGIFLSEESRNRPRGIYHLHPSAWGSCWRLARCTELRNCRHSLNRRKHFSPNFSPERKKNFRIASSGLSKRKNIKSAQPPQGDSGTFSQKMAERVGFEPTCELPRKLISRAVKNPKTPYFSP